MHYYFYQLPCIVKLLNLLIPFAFFYVFIIFSTLIILILLNPNEIIFVQPTFFKFNHKFTYSGAFHFLPHFCCYMQLIYISLWNYLYFCCGSAFLKLYWFVFIVKFLPNLPLKYFFAEVNSRMTFLKRILAF